MKKESEYQSSQENKQSSFLLLLAMLLYPLGQIGRVTVFLSPIGIYLYEIALLTFALSVLLRSKKKELLAVFKEWIALPIFLMYLLVILLSTLGEFTPQENGIALAYWSRLALYFLFFAAGVAFFNRNKAREQIFLGPFRASVWILASLSVAQFFLYPDLRNLRYLGWDEHVFRAVSTFFDPSVAGAVFGLIFFIIVFHFKRLHKKSTWSTATAALYLILGILTFSRAFYVSFLIALLLLIFHKSKKVTLFLFISAFCGLLLINSLSGKLGQSFNLTRLYSVSSRADDYRHALGVWKSSPIVGIGYNRLGIYKRVPANLRNPAVPDRAASSLHSSFLIILSTGGVIGLGLFVWILARFALVSQTALIYTVFLSVFSLADNILLHPFVLFFYLLVLSREATLTRAS